MSGQRMCPNETCEHYRQPTGLLGGCDCGAALVVFQDKDEPTNEQLGRLVSLFASQTPGVPPISAEVAARIFDQDSRLRAAWLERHSEFQAALKSGRTRA